MPADFEIYVNRVIGNRRRDSQLGQQAVSELVVLG